MIRVMDETFEFFASMNILCYNGILEMRVIFVNITVFSERVRTSSGGVKANFARVRHLCESVTFFVEIIFQKY